jgi:hypothetical protein
MNYNVYLFVCLLKLYDKEFNELEYDLQFQRAPKLYDEFFASKFNDTKKGEYDCIIAYLKDKYPIMDKNLVIERIQAIIIKFDSFTTAEINADCDIDVSSNNRNIKLANKFFYDKANVEVYDVDGQFIISEYYLSYRDMSLEQLQEVLEYAEQWEVMCLQDEDRQTSM